MALIVTTNNREHLAADFWRMVAGGEIPTWVVDADGDFTISRDKWRNKAWMRIYQPEEDKSKLVFGIIGNDNVEMTKELYAVYHGRLSSTLLGYFDDMITDVTIKSQIDSDYDIVNR